MAIFNTLQYARKLEAAGVSVQQAEVQSYALAEIIEGVMVTKADLEKLELAVVNKLEGRMDAIDARLSSRIDSLEHSLSSRMDSLEYRLTIKMGAMMITMFAVAISVFKLWT